jgi:predicted RNase H-like nuclease
VKFLGIDLAWTQNNESGLIAFERDGTISDAGWTVGTAETLSWITARADEDTLIFVDAPLIVTNPAGTQRLCENHTEAAAEGPRIMCSGCKSGCTANSVTATSRLPPRIRGLRSRLPLPASA